MELISRDDAKRIIDNIDTFCAGWRDYAKEKIDNAPTIDPVRWIPVSERLPEGGDYRDFWETPDGAILWCKETGEVGVGWYYKSTKTWSDLWDNVVKDIVAWMPLPEPWRGEEDE